ncbi:DUF4838 domain-containing protein [Paenibacillus dokdonensis]|uniref:DUF4838 domain-containing protein n=1 Tax=Paenibacillus dokdonensis TaxID=2567944 RepID=UPI0010A7EB9F|nr:DUF4838 domain-containing protein [Paenibacillus dokdonensis]
MKKSGIRLMGAALIMSLVFAYISTRSPVHADSLNADELTVVDQHQAESAIIWWSKDNKTETAFYAASELRDYIKQSSGAAIPVIQGKLTEEGSGKLDHLDSALIIVTGDEAKSYSKGHQTADIPVEWLGSANMKLTEKKGDSFATITLENRLILAGMNNRGTLYAAYDLLETLGMKFFAPSFDSYQKHAEDVPVQSSITIQAQNQVQEPGFTIRRKYIEEGWSHSSDNIPALIDWMSKNKLNTLVVPYDYIAQGNTRWDDWREKLIPELNKRSMMVEVGGHGFESFLRKDKYGAEHPDWFISGYNVFNIANDEAVNAYVNEVIAYLKARPEISIFDAWPPDVATWPASVVSKFGSNANAYAYVVNKLHDAVNRELPGVRIEAIAYASHDQPPSSAYMYDESVLIDFAPYFRSYRDTVYDPSSSTNKPSIDLINKWKNVFKGDLTMYEYYRRYAFHSLPVVFPQLIGQELPYYKTLGVNGIGTYSEPGDWITFEATHLILAKMSWKPNADPQQLIQDYVNTRYGAASAEMGEYLRLVEEAGRTVFNQPAGDFGNINSVTKARENYMQAKTKLVSAQSKAQSGSSSSFMIERLAWNIDYAIADVEVDYYRLRNDNAASKEAKLRALGSLFTHRFDGIILQNSYSLRRYISGFGDPDWIYAMNRGQLQQAPMTTMGTQENNAISNMVDNNEATIYWSNTNPLIGDYVGVDLKFVQHIKEIQIKMSTADKPNDYIHHGVIEVSKDFSEWEAIAEVADQPEAQIMVEGGTEARFIRIRTTAAQNQWVQIREFTVKADSTGEPGESDELQTTLTTDKMEVKAGEALRLDMGLNHIADPVYAYDISLQYDPGVMEFVSAESVKDGMMLIESKDGDGKIRLIGASAGPGKAISTDSQLLQLTFLAKNVKVPTDGAFKVTSAILGGEDGEESVAAAASITVKAIPGTTEQSADLNGDGKISIGDLGIVAAHYGKDSSSPDWQQVKHADINGDGKIDIADLAAVASQMTEGKGTRTIAQI